MWLEPIDPKTPVEEIRKLTRLLKDRLEPYGLADSVALSSITTEPLDPATTEECLDIDAAREHVLRSAGQAAAARRCSKHGVPGSLQARVQANAWFEWGIVAAAPIIGRVQCARQPLSRD
jgi:hypothetical protein